MDRPSRDEVFDRFTQLLAKRAAHRAGTVGSAASQRRAEALEEGIQRLASWRGLTFAPSDVIDVGALLLIDDKRGPHLVVPDDWNLPIPGAITIGFLRQHGVSHVGDTFTESVGRAGEQREVVHRVAGLW